MARIRRIRVAVKELEAKSRPAVLKAAQVARACGSQLELFHTLTTPLYADLYMQPLDALEQELKQAAQRRLESIAARLRQPGLKVTVRVEWDAPVYEAIVRRARQIRADLIVVSSHAGRHAAPGLMRLTDWELVRLSPTPVLLVKNPRAYRHPAVLVAIDPRHAFAKPRQLDKIILHMGGSLCKSLRGTLHAVHAYARAPLLTAPAHAMTANAYARIERQAVQSAQRSFERALRGTRVARSRRYLVAADPVSGILGASRKSRSDILVMGAISRSGLKRLLIGNTAEKILDELKCDILVVKPAKFPDRVPRAVRGPQLLMSNWYGTFV
jgi:universal stress protein E